MLDRQCLVSSPVLLCKTGWQQFFVTAVTPIDICLSHKPGRETTKELQQCWTDSAWSLPLCCSAKQADNSFLSLQRHILILPSTQAWIGKPLKSCSSADRHCLVSSPVLLCKTGWQQFFVTAMTPIDICFHTSLERETTKELQQCWTDSAWSLPLCCSAKQAGNSFLSLQ